MKLKAYKTSNAKSVLRVTLVSDYLDTNTLEKYRANLDCSTIAPNLYISFYISYPYPPINIDEYFNYIELMGIDLTIGSKELKESFAVLVDIIEAKYGIEFIDSNAESYKRSQVWY